ncbi:hypothetical protein HK102_011346, partial [Quaeritorhiza haematococci]
FGTLPIEVEACINDTRPGGGDGMGRGAVTWLYRKGPLLVDFVLEDLEGNAFGVTVEYVCPELDLPERKEEDAGFVYVDNVDTWERTVTRIKVPKEKPKGLSGKTADVLDPEAVVLSVSVFNYSYDFSVHKLNHIVWLAENGETAIKDPNEASSDIAKEKTEEGVTTGQEQQSRPPQREIALRYINRERDGVTSDISALVDLSCRRVYAFKIMMISPTSKTVSFVPVPLYGLLEGEREVNQVDVKELVESMKGEGFVESETEVELVEQKKEGFRPRIEPPKPKADEEGDGKEKRKGSSGGEGGVGVGISKEEMEEMMRRVVSEEFEKMQSKVVEEVDRIVTKRVEAAVAEHVLALDALEEKLLSAVAAGAASQTVSVEDEKANATQKQLVAQEEMLKKMETKFSEQMAAMMGFLGNINVQLGARTPNSAS